MEHMAGDIPTKVLPGVMDAYYTKKYVMTSIKGFFGQFSLVQVANLRQNNVVTMMNFLGTKVYYVGKKGAIPAGIAELNDPKVEYTDDTMSICGMICKKAIVETTDSKYNIFYTDALDIKSPNITTPYNFIDDVLSDFRVQLSFLKMQLIMDAHESTTVESSIFDIPEDYTQVSKQSMESFINSLFTKE